MRAHPAWSYAPYRPPFVEVGNPYICRIEPHENRITFDWLPSSGPYTVFARLRGEGEFALIDTTEECTFTLTDLTDGQNWEFFVRDANGDRSRTRLAKCAPIFGNVVNYLHPEDEAYAFSGRYLCSPSIVRHPDGYLLASMDLFAGNHPQNLTLIYRSDDDGQSWHYVSELFPCFWGKMFIHDGALFMLAVSTEYGDLLIGRSDDGGKTFTPPTVLLRGGGGKNGESGVHKNPQPVVEFGGRIWNTLEWGAWGRGYHAAMVMSAPLGADLLNPAVWAFSEPLKYNPDWPDVPKGTSAGNIEGCLVEKDGQLWNIMRYDMTRLTPNYGLVLCYRVNTENPEAPLEYDHAIPFPANHSKFVIKRHEGSGKFYSLASRIRSSAEAGARNLLSLMVSADCEHWEVDRDVLDYTHCDPKQVGFQYVDFLIEGDEIRYLCRTAINGAHNFHDANYSIFSPLCL